MSIYASKSTRGFYDTAIHGYSMPGDVVEITAEEHAALLEGQSQGKVIDFDEAGRPVLADLPPPTEEQQVAAFQAAIQHHLDAAARAAGYDDIKTAITYADEPAVQKFQEEGRAFRVWRSLCWHYAYEQLDAVQTGGRAQPTVDEFIAELPVLQM